MNINSKISMPPRSRAFGINFATSALLLAMVGANSAMALPLLGTDLSTFTVLGAATVTNVPTSTISGNVGVWSSGGANAITGFLSSPGLAVADPQVTSGLVHAGTAGAAAAQGQLTSAITNLSSLGVGTLLGADLVGMTLTPGVYTVPAGTSNLSGVLILDGQGNANAAWVFQMASTLITSANSVVSVTNTGQGAGVFWNVASSATLGSNTSFMGNILAVASISLNTGARDNCGRVLAKTGAVTLQMNTLSNSCTGLLSGSDGLGGGLDVTTSPEGITSVAFLPFAPITPNVPEPASLALFGIGICGICGLGAFRRRRG
ncbi:DUF3494 domain-containing protein [Paucibacter sp. KCTC 42545]|uniref:DUF3494 domain-containing protein n=1 Tax=Paucibacter sp. KCTC 42545 TaxID=1768242 RepID=UPI0009E93729|nr:DUF3494 domain-containing protein [Paucibacter sp. KCTC 42545]